MKHKFARENSGKPVLLLAAPYFSPRYYGGAVKLFEMLVSGISRFEPVVYADDQEGSRDELAAFDAEVAGVKGYRIERGPMLLPEFPGDLALPHRVLRVAQWGWRARQGWLGALRRVRPQIVVAGNTYNCGWLWNASRGRYLKVNYIHGEELTQDLAYGPLSRRLKQAQLESLRCADLNIAVSRFSADLVTELSGASPARLQVLPNAVDVQRFKPLPEPQRLAWRARMGWERRSVLLTVSRLIERKAVDQVLRALACARNLPADWLFVIAGRGPQEPLLRELVAHLGLQDRVRLLGYVGDEDLPAMYGAADVFIQANRRVNGDTEGFGIVYLEASACGTPVIGGTDGGTADAISEGVSGFRVDGDDVDAVRGAIERLMGDPALRLQMATQGLNRVLDGFTADGYVRRFEDMVMDAWQHKLAVG
ncbi:MAG: glycosyltransferase family 4 protein [Rubrivivax sp.]